MAELKNLATNPRFAQVAPGDTVVRRNLAGVNTRAQESLVATVPNNAGVLSNSRWFGGGTSGFTAGTRTRVATGGPTPDLPAFLRKTWSVSPTHSLDTGFLLTKGYHPTSPTTTDGIPVVEGMVYTVSLYVRASFALEHNYVQVSWKDSQGNALGAVSAASSVSKIGGWGRVFGTFTAPARAAYGEFLHFVSGATIPQPGDTLDATGLLIEKRPAVLPYFDGSTPDDLGFVYDWEGVENASSSVVKAATVTVRENLATNPSFKHAVPGGTVVRTNLVPTPFPTKADSTEHWGHGGPIATSSLETTGGPTIDGRLLPWRKQTATQAATTAAAIYTTPTGSSASKNAIPVVAGRTYAFSIYGLSSVSGASGSLRVRLYDAQGVSVGTQTFNTTAMSAGVWQRLTAVMVAPTGAVTAAIDFFMDTRNVQVGDFIGATGALGEERAIVLPYFDGSTPAAGGYEYGWSGAAAASSSVAKMIVVRRNYATNPVPASTTGYGPANGAVVTYISTPYQAVDVECAAGGATDVGVSVAVRSSWEAGERWTVSFDFEALTAGTYKIPYTGGGMTPSSGANPFTLAAGEKRRISVTYLLHSKQVGVVYVTRTDTAYARFRVSKVLIEKRPAVLPYFYGDTPDALGFTYDWAGEANASESVAKAAVGEVRRNLAMWPRGVGGASAYDHPSAQTITPGVVVTDHPSGISTATRVEYAADSLNPGVGFMDTTSIPPNTQVTLSAWVKPETDHADTRYGFALKGQTSEARDLTVGAWSRITWTAISDSQSRIAGFRVSGAAPGAGAYLVTGVMVELSPRTGDYFDGYTTPDADLTPVWEGAPNASASVLYGVKVADVSGTAVFYQSWSEAGEVSLAIPRDPRGSVDAISMPQVVAGKTFTIMARIHVPSAIPSGQARFGVRTWNGSTPDVQVEIPGTVGVHEVRVTFTASPGTTSTSFRIWNQTNPYVDLRIDNLVIIEGAYTDPYFDGDMQSTDADLIQGWSGTPHASTTVQRGVLISTHLYAAGRVVISSFEGGMRIIPTTGSETVTGYGAVVAATSGGVYATLEPGKTYTAIARVTLPAAISGPIDTARFARLYLSAGSTTPEAAAEAVPNVPGEYLRRLVFRVPTHDFTYQLRLGHGATSGVLRWADLALFEGVYEGPYLDGDSPGATWDGTPHASASTKPLPALTVWDADKQEERWLDIALAPDPVGY